MDNSVIASNSQNSTDMSALAIFVSRPNSHPFQERHVSAREAVKVGRSVARARPAPNNAIFDCKVLSRNHALLWYENGQFLLQDTKSSNGTFVNNQRLSKGSEESPPHEIFSGDIVQFGVDVMENSRRVTHSCIIASVQLYHPDGREATSDHSSPFLNTGAGGSNIQSQELFQIAQYLQEALHREKMLESKLEKLQMLVQSTQTASETGWQALIDEDRLLSRLEVLENQLQAYSKNQTDETLKQELSALQDDKYKYENTAKESLRRVLEEKLDTAHKLADLEASLSKSEDECSVLRNMCDMSQNEFQDLADKHEQRLKEVSSLQDQLVETEKKLEEEMARAEQEKTDLHAKLDQMTDEEHLLQAKIESLEADGDFTKEQLANIKAKMEAIKENTGCSTKIPESDNKGVQVEIVNLLDLHQLTEHIKEPVLLLGNGQHSDNSDGKENGERDESEVEQIHKTDLEESLASRTKLEEKLQETQDRIEEYKSDLEQSRLEIAAHVAQISYLEVSLSEAKKLDEGSNAFIQQLKDLSSVKEESASLRQRIQDIEMEIRKTRLENQELQVAYTNLQQSYRELQEAKESGTGSPLWENNMTDAHKEAETKLEMASEEVSSLKEECFRYKQEVDSLHERLDNINIEYQEMLYQTKTVSTCSVIPLLILLFAIILAFSPFLSGITATTLPT